MMEIYKWVVESRRVSSKDKTKLFSVVFVLLLAATALALGSLQISVASDITIDNIVSLTNQSRSGAGRNALVVNPRLLRAAEEKAGDMIDNNYFSHTSPAGRTPWDWIKGENYDYSYAGENLAMDFHTAEKMEEAWMASPTHRANILNEKYTEIGAAVREGSVSGHETILAVVMFGSGDRSLPSAEGNVEKNTSELKEGNKAEKSIPVLFAGEERKNGLALEPPVITSPRAGEKLSEKEVKIIGRAKPAEAVDIFDNNNFVGSAVADSSGWFSLTEEGLLGGSHRLSLRGGKTYLGLEKEFYVDHEKPGVDFRLYADKNNPRRFFLEANASKDNCMLRFDKETRIVNRGERAVFAVSPEKSSAVLRISDQAGNRNFRQISLANYYFGDGKENMTEKLAAIMFSPENIFAADSGREAVKNNLGLASHQFFALRSGGIDDAGE